MVFLQAVNIGRVRQERLKRWNSSIPFSTPLNWMASHFALFRARGCSPDKSRVPASLEFKFYGTYKDGRLE